MPHLHNLNAIFILYTGGLWDITVTLGLSMPNKNVVYEKYKKYLLIIHKCCYGFFFVLGGVVGDKSMHYQNCRILHT